MQSKFQEQTPNNNLKCTFCKTDEDDSQKHLLECIESARRHKGKSITQEKIEYQDIATLGSTWCLLAPPQS